MASSASHPPIRIEDIAHGGDGIGTLPDGKKVFVPLAAPGDLVRIEGLSDRGQHAHGRIGALLEASPARVEPPCPHVERCGGCQLQHLAEATQREARERSFYGVLERVGGVPRSAIPDARPIVPSPEAFRYRIRCRLHVRGGKVGYLGRGSHDLEAIQSCHLLAPPLEALALAVAGFLEERPLPGLREIDLCIGADGVGAMALHPDPKVPAGWTERAQRHFRGVEGRAVERRGEKGRQVEGRGAHGLLAEGRAAQGRAIEGLKGIVVIPPPMSLPRGVRMPPGSQRSPPKLLGDPVVERQAPLSARVRLLARPDAFAQANAEGNELLVRAAIEGLDLQPSDEVLELYGGAGNFTFALAERVTKVVVVEEAGVSLDLGRLAAATAAIENIRFIAGDAGAVVRDWVGLGRKVDRVLLDPPRAGAKGLAAGLAALEPRRIAYVSCEPATLARDLAAFREHGYAPVIAVPVDMFPQTYHVEGVVILERI